ncbi:VOC family protein [Shewanella subflava]|uniref:VOC family protein n=1 Tax=Shewanella subflava TaxID=2986476 RepID=A0ABT3IAZ6_9GAMM|nr:VOC family protein [Shewanella subflava]MCW3173224.1 VOC family protein [Shewanella subflava]
MNLNIEKVGQIAIAVTDINKSVAFYQDILGLSLLFEVPSGLAFFNCGDTRIMLTTLQGKSEDHKTSVIYYQVSDIHHATKHLKAKGVTFEREPQLAAKMTDHHLWIGFLRDPDNNLIGLMAELPLE